MKKQLEIEIKHLTPPIKWAGGKRWLAPRIAEIYKSVGAKRLVEPFCGGCAVTLHTLPKEALLNDLNSNLIWFWRFISSGGKLALFKNDAETFYQKREEYNKFTNAKGLSTLEAPKNASLFYYLNKTCFNGLYRVNLGGEYNVPFGKRKKVLFEKEFPEIERAARMWKFENTPYQQVRTRKTDLVYIDPPYDVKDESFVDFTSDGFCWMDQVRLANWAARQPGTVVASNLATNRIVDLYRERDFKVSIIDAPRRISCNGNREKAREILAIRGKK